MNNSHSSLTAYTSAERWNPVFKHGVKNCFLLDKYKVEVKRYCNHAVPAAGPSTYFFPLHVPGVLQRHPIAATGLSAESLDIAATIAEHAVTAPDLPDGAAGVYACLKKGSVASSGLSAGSLDTAADITEHPAAFAGLPAGASGKTARA